jgi:hypothetical protein
MITFKDFLVLEAKNIESLPTKNIGDAMEVIFAIVIGVYLADGTVNLEKVNRIKNSTQFRTDASNEILIDSNIAENSWIVNNIPHIKPGNKIAVKVSAYVKTSAIPYLTQSDLTDDAFKQSVGTLINNWENSKTIKIIQNYIKNILTDRHPDRVVFYVVADGKISSSGPEKGTVKGDVQITIRADSDIPIPKDLESISFSVKTENLKVGNPSFFGTLFNLAKSFKIPIIGEIESWDKLPEIATLRNDLYRYPAGTGKYANLADNKNHLFHYIRNYFNLSQKKEEQKQYTYDILKMFMEYMSGKFKEASAKNPEEFAAKAFDFIEHQIFGADKPKAVVRVMPKVYHELSQDDFRMLKNKYDVEFAPSENTMFFTGVDKQTKERVSLFNIRLNPTSGSPRFDVPLGAAFKSV